MPFFDDQLAGIGCNRLCFGQITQFEALGLAQLDTVIQNKHGLASSAADMDVNWWVLVAVEEEHESVLFKDPWHSVKMAETRAVGYSQQGWSFRPSRPSAP